MNDEIEGATITESNSGEVTHVACRQSTDAQRLGQRHHRDTFVKSDGHGSSRNELYVDWIDERPLS